MFLDGLSLTSWLRRLDIERFATLGNRGAIHFDNIIVVFGLALILRFLMVNATALLLRAGFRDVLKGGGALEGNLILLQLRYSFTEDHRDILVAVTD